MIERVEQALIVWGDEYRRQASGASLPCVLGTAMENGGVMVRGTVPLGSVMLFHGGMGAVGEAVEAGLVRIGQTGPEGQELVKLARVRYLTDPMPLVEHQMRRMRYRSRDTYERRVHLLHSQLEPLLEAALPRFMRAA